MKVQAPLSGQVIDLTEVPDPVFAQRLLGPGTAIDPARSGNDLQAVAPINGTVAKLYPHAYVITNESLTVLVHLGIDTVQLKGEGFTTLVLEGDSVTAGTPIVRWNPSQIENAGRNPVCMIVVMDAQGEVEVTAQSMIKAGEQLFHWKPKRISSDESVDSEQ